MGWWLCSMLMLLCLACSSSGDADTVDDENAPKLEIHIYTPGRQNVTRSIGEVQAEEKEREINSMSIWVFEHASNKLVGYMNMNPNELPTDENQERMYRLTVSNEFVAKIPRPTVDVFVVANVVSDNTGLSLDRNSSKTDLQNAVIKDSYFGISEPSSDNKSVMIQEVPEGIGLPMSGALYDQPVEGPAPIVKVDAKVQMMRAVSKLRFVFSRAKSDDPKEDLRITKITLTPSITSSEVTTITTIPLQEKLFLNGRISNVSGGYYDTEKTLVTPSDVAIPECEKPAKYAYVNQTGEEYEELINTALAIEPAENRDLVQLGRFYLRESDKQLEGKIYYKTKSKDVEWVEKSATFKMSGAGDFSRNHTWIVYGYFAGENNLKIFNVMVTPWATSSQDHPVYNW